MGIRTRLAQLERRSGRGKPPRLIVAIEQPEGGTYQGSDGGCYSLGELEALGSQGAKVVAVQKRRETP